MDGWMNGWMDRLLNRWMDGWMDGWIVGWMDEIISKFQLHVLCTPWSSEKQRVRCGAHTSALLTSLLSPSPSHTQMCSSPVHDHLG